MAGGHVSVPKSFSDGDAREWFQRFEICCSANQWNDEIKARKLPTLLEGEALASWLELSDEQQADYKVAKEQLITKMAPNEFVSLEESHSRTMRPGEAIALYLHDLSDCYNKPCQDWRKTQVTRYCYTSFCLDFRAQSVDSYVHRATRKIWEL